MDRAQITRIRDVQRQARAEGATIAQATDYANSIVEPDPEPSPDLVPSPDTNASDGAQPPEEPATDGGNTGTKAAKKAAATS